MALLGRFRPRLGGSEYQKLRLGRVEGDPPDVDLKHEKRAVELVLQAIQTGCVSAVQDVSLGGLLPTLLEMAFLGQTGVVCHTAALMAALPDRAATDPQRLDALCFGETGGTYILAYTSDQEAALCSLIEAQGADAMMFLPLGHTMSDYELRLPDWNLTMPLAPLEACWRQALKNLS